MPRFFRYTRPFAIAERERHTPVPRTLATPLVSNRLSRQEREVYVRFQQQKIRDDPQPRKFVKDREKIGPKDALSIASALSRFVEADFSDPKKRTLYRDLRAQQNALRNATIINQWAKGSKSSSGGGLGKSTAAGADRRQFNPSDPQSVGSDVYGNPAPVAGNRYKRPRKALTCIERAVKRSVMFALGSAGVGYRTKKGPKGIPC
ncbi:hypothetical protein [robinz microvirus RP_147]|nr:hypothetical protein [robinz microvirus RP_147]